MPSSPDNEWTRRQEPIRAEIDEGLKTLNALWAALTAAKPKNWKDEKASTRQRVEQGIAEDKSDITPQEIDAERKEIIDKVKEILERQQSGAPFTIFLQKPDGTGRLLPNTKPLAWQVRFRNADGTYTSQEWQPHKHEGSDQPDRIVVKNIPDSARGGYLEMQIEHHAVIMMGNRLQDPPATKMALPLAADKSRPVEYSVSVVETVATTIVEFHVKQKVGEEDLPDNTKKAILEDNDIMGLHWTIMITTADPSTSGPHPIPQPDTRTLRIEVPQETRNFILSLQEHNIIQFNKKPCSGKSTGPLTLQDLNDAPGGVPTIIIDAQGAAPQTFDTSGAQQRVAAHGPAAASTWVKDEAERQREIRGLKDSLEYIRQPRYQHLLADPAHAEYQRLVHYLERRLQAFEHMKPSDPGHDAAVVKEIMEVDDAEHLRRVQKIAEILETERRRPQNPPAQTT